MNTEKCFGELYTERGNEDGWYLGGYCHGFSCPNYKTCSGRLEFEGVPKHTPTDYEIEEAIRRERRSY